MKQFILLTLLALITVIVNCKGKTYEDLLKKDTTLNLNPTQNTSQVTQIIVKVNHSEPIPVAANTVNSVKAKKIINDPHNPPQHTHSVNGTIDDEEAKLLVSE